MDDVYTKLRERLDMFPQGFPATESKVEIKILKHLFSPDEAEIMLFVRPFPEPVSVIAGRMKRDDKELGGILYDMSKRGLILRFRMDEKNVFYFLAPWMVGIWEFQLKNLTDENIKIYEQYREERMTTSNRDYKVSGFRVIPIEQEIQHSAGIETHEKVSDIIESSVRFAVADCICRKEAHMRGKGCDKLMEGCMMFDMAADYYIENGLGREISKEEARQVLAKAEEDGLVHHSSNHKGKKIFICNCCSCCCKAIDYAVRYNPNAIAKSNYYAAVTEDECAGCESCIERCQIGAIHMEDDIARINQSVCIGCGLCVPTCPTECIKMDRRLPEKSSPPFASDVELIQSMAAERGKTFPFE